jgi:transcription initiation factor TFIIIB Brf1 subunit/transcription initiation factor TFIIB
MNSFLCEEDSDIWKLFNVNINDNDNVNDNDNDKVNDNDKKKISKLFVCISCESDYLINDNGNVVCKNCGTINEHIFDRNPEWIHNEDGKNDGSIRCGAPINYYLPNSSLSTVIAGGNEYNKLRKLHSWSQQPYDERSRNDVNQIIDEKCKSNNISKAVAENGKYLYKKISEIKHKSGINQGKKIIIRGKNRKSIIAACVFNGAEVQKQPLSLKDIASIFEIDVTQITQGIAKLEELLDKEPLLQNNDIIDPIKFISSYHGKLGLQRDYIPISIKVFEYLSHDDIVSNHQPVSIAAGITLLISKIYNLDINKKKISTTLKISEVTINKIYNKINNQQVKDIIINYK